MMAEVKTHIANVLDSQLDGKQMYDKSIKEVLADKQVLARILKYSVEEFSEMSVDDIINGITDTEINEHPLHPSAKYGTAELLVTEDSAEGEGFITFDIRCKAKGKTEKYYILINVEAQRTIKSGQLHYHIENRVVYYLARMVSGQKEHEFFSDDYDNIKKCRSIWICLDDDADDDGSIEEFRFVKDVKFGNESGIKCPDLMRGVIIRLKQNDDFSTSRNKLISMLEDLIANKEAEEKIKQLVEKHGIADTVEIREEVSNMCNWSTAVEERGIERGIERGLDQGIERGKIEMIIRALEEHSDDEVKAFLKVSDLEIQQARAGQDKRKTLMNV